MIECRFRPVAEWPVAPTRFPKSSAFKAKWSQTLDLLERELNHLSARDVIIEGYFEFSQIRNDGWPKSLARPSRPGVVLDFEIPKKGRMAMPCDTYDHWESNLRAIALTLKNLRTIQRYGVTTERQEQYTGWLKLPAASAADELTEHVKTLYRFAGRNGDVREALQNQTFFDSIWKEASRKTHPDTGGNAESFRVVIAARDRIRALKGWA